MAQPGIHQLTYDLKAASFLTHISLHEITPRYIPPAQNFFSKTGWAIGNFCDSWVAYRDISLINQDPNSSCWRVAGRICLAVSGIMLLGIPLMIKAIYRINLKNLVSRIDQQQFREDVRQHQQQLLDDATRRVRQQASTRIQTAFRAHQAREQFHQQKAAIILQKNFRVKIAQRRVAQLKEQRNQAIARQRGVDAAKARVDEELRQNAERIRQQGSRDIQALRTGLEEFERQGALLVQQRKAQEEATRVGQVISDVVGGAIDNALRALGRPRSPAAVAAGAGAAASAVFGAQPAQARPLTPPKEVLKNFSIRSLNLGMRNFEQIYSGKTIAPTEENLNSILYFLKFLELCYENQLSKEYAWVIQDLNGYLAGFFQSMGMYNRPSSHLKGMSDQSKHFGRDQESYLPGLAGTVDYRRTVLVIPSLESDLHKDLIFIKPEDFGLSTAYDFAGHGYQFLKSQTEKYFYGANADAQPGLRKERIPPQVVQLSADIRKLNAATKEGEAKLPEGNTVAELWKHYERPVAGEPESAQQFRDLARTYRNQNIQIGNEVNFTIEDIFGRGEDAEGNRRVRPELSELIEKCMQENDRRENNPVSMSGSWVDAGMPIGTIVLKPQDLGDVIGQEWNPLKQRNSTEEAQYNAVRHDFLLDYPRGFIITLNGQKFSYAERLQKWLTAKNLSGKPQQEQIDAFKREEFDEFFNQILPFCNNDRETALKVLLFCSQKTLTFVDYRPDALAHEDAVFRNDPEQPFCITITRNAQNQVLVVAEAQFITERPVEGGPSEILYRYFTEVVLNFSTSKAERTFKPLPKD